MEGKRQYAIDREIDVEGEKVLGEKKILIKYFRNKSLTH